MKLRLTLTDGENFKETIIIPEDLRDKMVKNWTRMRARNHADRELAYQKLPKYIVNILCRVFKVEQEELK